MSICNATSQCTIKDLTLSIIDKVSNLLHNQGYVFQTLMNVKQVLIFVVYMQIVLTQLAIIHVLAKLVSQVTDMIAQVEKFSIIYFGEWGFYGDFLNLQNTVRVC